MDRKNLGSTSVKLPVIGLGTWAYTGGNGPLRRGIELGADHIDTAESYGTEDAVGAAVRGIRDRVFISTKISPAHFEYDDVMRAAENSLRRLGTDYIDLYQLHSPSPDIPLRETMAAMDRLVEDGKTRFIGVSNFSVEQLKEAQAASAHEIVSNQVVYNLMNRDIEQEILPYCQENQVTVIAYTPVGRFVGGKDAGPVQRALRRVSEATGKTVAQVAINWCISKPGVITIPKSDSLQHTEENCGASGWSLSPEHVRLLEEAR